MKLLTVTGTVGLETVWKIEMGPEMEIREAPRGHKGVSTGLFCHQTRTVENPSSIFQTVSGRGVLGSSHPRSCI
jgi:hypothetical protein